MVARVELPIGTRRVVEGSSGDFYVSERVDDPILGITDKLKGPLSRDLVDKVVDGQVISTPDTVQSAPNSGNQ